MTNPAEKLVDLLDLEQVEVNIFRGRSTQESLQRVFGGQVAGQALVAAAAPRTANVPCTHCTRVSCALASLDHAMWFHRPFRADEWFLYDQESPIVVPGRGLARGRIYDREGRLLASVVQEGLFRRLAR